MAKKITDNRLEKLEMSSTDDDTVSRVVAWSTDGLSSTDEDVIHVTWSDIEED